MRSKPMSLSDSTDGFNLASTRFQLGSTVSTVLFLDVFGSRAFEILELPCAIFCLFLACGFWFRCRKRMFGMCSLRVPG